MRWTYKAWFFPKLSSSQNSQHPANYVVREERALSQISSPVSTLSARNAWHYVPHLWPKKNGLHFLTQAFLRKPTEARVMSVRSCNNVATRHNQKHIPRSTTQCKDATLNTKDAVTIFNINEKEPSDRQLTSVQGVWSVPAAAEHTQFLHHVPQWTHQIRTYPREETITGQKWLTNTLILLRNFALKG